jgi:hypothetical protein
MNKVFSRGDAEARRVALRGSVFRVSGLSPIGQPDGMKIARQRDLHAVGLADRR